MPLQNSLGKEHVLVEHVYGQRLFTLQRSEEQLTVVLVNPPAFRMPTQRNRKCGRTPSVHVAEIRAKIDGMKVIATDIVVFVQLLV